MIVNTSHLESHAVSRVRSQSLRCQELQSGLSPLRPALSSPNFLIMLKMPNPDGCICTHAYTQRPHGAKGTGPIVSHEDVFIFLITHLLMSTLGALLLWCHAARSYTGGFGVLSWLPNQ